MLYKRVAAVAAAALVVGSGSLMGFRDNSPRPSAAGHAAYTAPPVFLTDWEPPTGFGPGDTGTNLAYNGVLFAGLDLIDNHLQIQPDMATDLPTRQNGGVKVVNGNLVVTWHLKPGLKWADGTPITTDQSIFALKLSETPEGSYPSGLDIMRKLTAPDARTLVVTYRGLYGSYLFTTPGFLNYRNLQRKYGVGDVSQYAKGDYDRESWQRFVLTKPSDPTSAETAAYKASSFAKLNTAFQADHFTKPDDGSFNGPYKVKEFVAGQRITFAPNTYYNVHPAPQPLPSEIRYVNVSQDPTAYAAALQSPSVTVDEAEDFQYSDVATLKNIARFHLIVQPALQFEHLELNLQNKFLADVKVRRAMALAINKVELMRLAFPDLKNPGAYVMNSFFPPLHPFYDPSVKAVYDPAQAEASLRSGGYCTATVHQGCRQVIISIDTTARFPRPLTAEVLKRDWARIGITLKINAARKATGQNSLFGDWGQNGRLSHRNFDVTLFTFGISPDPDLAGLFLPEFIPTPASHSGNAQNYAGINDAVLTNALHQAAGSLDISTRRRWYNIAQQRMAEQVYWIPLYTRQNVVVESGKIINLKVNPCNNCGDYWNAWEWGKKTQ